MGWKTPSLLASTRLEGSTSMKWLVGLAGGAVSKSADTVSPLASAVLSTARVMAGGATIWVITVDLSSFGVRSWGTLAVLVTDPILVGCTFTVTAELVWLGASVPTLHMM